VEKKGLKKHRQEAVPVVLVPQSVEDDEINLMDLGRVLVKRKVAAICVAIAVVVVAVAYALLASPVYKAEAYLLPPLNKSVQALQVVQSFQDSQAPQSSQDSHDTSKNDISPTQKAYSLFVQNLKSWSLLRRYFDSHHLADGLATRHHTVDVEREFKGFVQNFSVHQDRKNRSDVHVSFQGHDAALAAKWVNGIVALANEQTVRMLVQDVSAKLTEKRKQLRNQIAAKRKFAHLRREDRIDTLVSALHIAETLGIKESRVTGQQGDNGSPLYMMGSKALKAQIEILRQRKNDDPYIPGLRDLQETLGLLEGIHIDPSDVSAVRIDQKAIAPEHPIRPKRTLIVVLGLIVGSVLGVFVAFFAEFVARFREE